MALNKKKLLGEWGMFFLGLSASFLINVMMASWSSSKQTFIGLAAGFILFLIAYRLTNLSLNYNNDEAIEE